MLLNRRLSELYTAIEAQINHVHELAAERDLSPQTMMDSHGNFLLSPLLLSQSQVLLAQVHLNKE